MNCLKISQILLLCLPACFLNTAARSADAITDAQIKASMRRAFDWQIAHRFSDEKPNPTHGDLDPRGWVHGAFMTGVMEAYRTTGDTAYLDYAWKWAGTCEWSPGPKSWHADDHIASQTYIELAEIDPARANLKPTIATFDRLISEKHDGAKLLKWCDALYMQPPTMARLAKITGDSKYLDEMKRLFWESTAHLYDPAERLYFRDKRYMPHDEGFKLTGWDDYLGKEVRFLEKNGSKVFWSRGNGWVFAGLARILDYLPANDPQREKFEQLFKTFAARILELQSPDGLWRMGLLDPDAYGHGEESGSAFFVYGFAWGVRQGLLPKKDFAPAIEKGWRGLASLQRADGMVGYVQPIGAAPGSHSADTWQEYGTGAFLLAAAEMLKLPADARQPCHAGADGATQRAYLVSVLARIAEPVLAAGADGKLKTALPKLNPARDQFAPLEALGRTLTGIAPWLELGPGARTTAEEKTRARLLALALESIRRATDPASPAFMIFDKERQPLVDAAFLAQSLLRARTQLWGNLDAAARANVIAALKSTRVIKPGNNNWKLFSAMVEAALLEFDGACETVRIDDAVNAHLDWYKGDGTYGDGPAFHWDYYNSYVIQPMLLEIVEICARKRLPAGKHLSVIRARAIRYAEIQERMISPEGTFPIIGRSSAYRFGAFQALSLMALRRQLPSTLTPAGVRGALTAVTQRMIEAPGTFDAHGWLQRGAVGAQPGLAEGYINTGSLYLCTAGLLHLGLPDIDPFWTAPAAPWTQQRLWAGENLPGDHALREDAGKESAPAYPSLNNQKIAGYKGIWFTLGQFTKYGDKYSGGLATYTAKHIPLAIYSPEAQKTFFVYGGIAEDRKIPASHPERKWGASGDYLLCMVGSYDHKTGTLTKPTVVHDKQGVFDPHDNPSIAMDADGYVWVFVSGRGTARPGFIYKSRQPYSVDAFDKIMEGELTYPQPKYVEGKGFLHLFTKYAGRRLLYFNTSADGRKWTEHTQLAAMKRPGDKEGGHYQISGQLGKKIVFFFNWHPNGDPDKRTNIYYMQTTDFGKTWTTVDGEVLPIPQTDIAGRSLVREFFSKNENVYIKDVAFDEKGNPIALYVSGKGHTPGPDNGLKQWQILYWNGKAWENHAITTSDHNYDTGSLWAASGKWTVIGPTENTPQAWGGGGELVMWESTDKGKTWTRAKQITQGSPRNHNYVRKVANGADPFLYFWADGNPSAPSKSEMYFGDSKGTIWRMPYNMPADTATPEELK